MRNENAEMRNGIRGTGPTTEDDLNRGLKAFFAARVSPPAGVKAVIAGKLSTACIEAERRKTVGRCFLILVYAMLFSVSLLGMLWMILGAGVILLVVSFYLFTTLVCGLALTLALRFLTKGGNGYAVCLD